MSLDWASYSPRLVGSGGNHINRLQSAVEVNPSASRPEACGTQLCAGNMTSLTWGLLCFIGILAPGTLGTFPQFGSRNRQIHSISPLIPRVSSQVPPRVYQSFEDIKSIEHTSDEVPSAETFQEVQLGGDTSQGYQQQQGAQPGANNNLVQDRRIAGNRGWLMLCVRNVQYQCPPTCFARMQ